LNIKKVVVYLYQRNKRGRLRAAYFQNLKTNNIMKLVYSKTSHNSNQEWIFEVDTTFDRLNDFPKRGARNGLDIDDWLTSKGYKELNIESKSLGDQLCGRELGNGWTSHYIAIFK